MIAIFHRAIDLQQKSVMNMSSYIKFKTYLNGQKQLIEASLWQCLGRYDRILKYQHAYEILYCAYHERRCSCSFLAFSINSLQIFPFTFRERHLWLIESLECNRVLMPSTDSRKQRLFQRGKEKRDASKWDGSKDELSRLLKLFFIIETLASRAQELVEAIEYYNWHGIN